MRVGYAGSTIQLAAKLPVVAVEPALAELKARLPK
jgi:hypothetical protein